MTGGLSLLTAFALIHGFTSAVTALLMFFSMAFITSAGFSINDYFDRASDAIIKPKRPLPSGILSTKQALAASAVLFVLGLGLALLINTLCFSILIVDSALLLFYSTIVKRKSGFAANLLVGLLVGTGFLYGEAAVFATVNKSIALYPICFGTIGGNILRDVLSLEGDVKIGYPTLPQRIGSKKAVRVAVFFFVLTGVLVILPVLVHVFSLKYLFLTLVWSFLLCYSSFRLVTSQPNRENVMKYERLITMSMILLPLSLLIEAFA
jgi:geranylgeranylglycerol-phosphate geranylgeranyltransferase